MAFERGDYVWIPDRWHGGTVVGRLVIQRGSEWQVAWIGPAGTVYEMAFAPEDLTPLPTPEQAKAIAEATAKVQTDAVAAEAAQANAEAAARETDEKAKTRARRPQFPR